MDSSSISPALVQQASHARDDAAALLLLKTAELGKDVQQQNSVKPAPGPGKGGKLDTSA